MGREISYHSRPISLSSYNARLETHHPKVRIHIVILILKISGHY